MGRAFDNIEKEFYDDVRSKKRTGRGAFAMRGKGVKHGISGALKTPYHFMSSKERKKLNGKVEVFYMYETIIPIEEFELKDEEIQKKMLMRWREIYSTQKIKKELGIANTGFYKLIEKLGIPKRKTIHSNANRTKKKKQEESKSINIAVSPEIKDKPEFLPKEQEQPVFEQKLITKGLHLEFNGTYDCDELTKLFTKLQLLVEGEPAKYNIYLTLTEKQNN